MSILAKLIVDCPKYGHDEFLINTQVKYFSDEAIIDFEEIC
jgi:hypothetical protein